MRKWEGQFPAMDAEDVGNGLSDRSSDEYESEPKWEVELTDKGDKRANDQEPGKKSWIIRSRRPMNHP